MTSKSERTRQFILERVSPVFNKNGYAGTSLSDITKSTGLTKGAVYGNFSNKEELALQAFNHNIRYVMSVLGSYIEPIDSPLGKLKGITDFYRTYYDLTIEFGGCPIVNVGVDANHQNPLLMARVEDVITKLENSIKQMIDDGIKAREIKPDLDSLRYARRIYTMIEGSIFMASTRKNGAYLTDMMDHIDDMIQQEMML